MNYLSIYKSNILISIVQVLCLILVFFYFGEYSVFYFGSLLFFSTGYVFTTEKKTYKNLLYFIPSVFIFLLLVLTYFVFKLNSGDGINMPKYLGFILYFFVFSFSFALGWLLTAMIRNKNIKQLVFYSILSILLIRASMFFGRPFYASFSGIVVFIFSYRLFISTKISKAFIVLSLSIPFFFIFVLSGDIFEEQFAVFLFILLSIGLSFILSKSTRKRRAKSIVLSTYFLLIGINTVFMMNWVEYLYTRHNKLPEKEFSESFIDLQGNITNNNDFEGKIVVLDLWTTSCGVCFKKFPEFEKFYVKNKLRSDIVIYAIGIPNRWQERAEVESVVCKMDYDFPFLVSKNNFQHYRTNYNINGVPAIIVLNKNGEIVYNSSFNNNPLIIVNNLQKIIDKLLEPEANNNTNNL